MKHSPLIMRTVWPVEGGAEKDDPVSQKQFQESPVADDLGRAVSVVILSYNSREFLRRCVTAALNLDWPNLEVIVVDNASSDGSPDMVASEFGDRVQLIRRDVNSPTAGRNEGFRAAKGEFILSLDDDIVLSDAAIATKGVHLFSKCSDVGVLAFKITSLEMPQEPLPEHWWHPVPVKEGKNRFFYTDFFCESAVFFRSEVFRATGGYDELLFQYFEGNDLALRLLQKGFNILFCPVLVCKELRVRGMQYRYGTRKNYLSLRNKLWLVWKHYPIGRAVWYAAVRITLAAIRSVRYGWAGYFWQATKEGLFAPSTIRAQRKPLKRAMWRKISRIRGKIYCDFSDLTEESKAAMRNCGRRCRGEEEKRNPIVV